MAKSRSVEPNGVKVKRLLQQTGLSQKQFASTAGVSERSLRNAIRGCRVDWVTLSGIARGFGFQSANPLVARRKVKGWTMHKCQRDFLRWDQRYGSTEHLIIQTIAINLATGWDNILAAINFTKAPSIFFEILVLTDKTEQLPRDAPIEVRSWSENATANLRHLREGIATYSGDKRVSIKVKQYCEVPSVHGMRGGYSTLRHYVTRCGSIRGPLPGYDWGEGKYRLIPAESKSPRLAQLRAEFDALFDRLWKTSGRPVVNLIVGPQQKVER